MSVNTFIFSVGKVHVALPRALSGSNPDLDTERLHPGWRSLSLRLVLLVCLQLLEPPNAKFTHEVNAFFHEVFELPRALLNPLTLLRSFAMALTRTSYFNWYSSGLCLSPAMGMIGLVGGTAA